MAFEVLDRTRPVKPVSEAEKIPAVAISRVALPDLTRQGQWLLDRLTQRWEHLNERIILGYLRGCTESRDFYFVKTNHAVGMARIIQRSLDPYPDIEEIFVFVDEPTTMKSLRHGAALYADFKRWGQTLGAAEMLVCRNTDVPKELIREAIGAIAKREQHWVALR